MDKLKVLNVHNKKELFLRYMESESFKEVDNKFKELIMSASN